MAYLVPTLASYEDVAGGNFFFNAPSSFPVSITA
jgi:hypothetical protein